MGRADFAAAWHDTRNTFIIHGGQTISGSVGDAWEWNGTSWARLNLADPEGDGGPGALHNHEMAYEAHHDYLVLYGGEGTLGKLWQGRLADAEKPGHLARFTTWAMDNCETPEFKEVKVLWRGGGEGHLDEPDKHGARLAVWEMGAWQLLDENGAPADSPTDLTWTTVDPDRIHRMLFGAYEELCFALTPKEANLTGRAKVATDYVEVIVSYRLTAEAPDACD